MHDGSRDGVVNAEIKDVRFEAILEICRNDGKVAIMAVAEVPWTASVVRKSRCLSGSAWGTGWAPHIRYGRIIDIVACSNYTTPKHSQKRTGRCICCQKGSNVQRSSARCRWLTIPGLTARLNSITVAKWMSKQVTVGDETTQPFLRLATNTLARVSWLRILFQSTLIQAS